MATEINMGCGDGFGAPIVVFVRRHAGDNDAASEVASTWTLLYGLGQ